MNESALVVFSLILARTGSFVATVPLLGGRAVPRTVKVGLALALAAMWFSSDSVAVVDESLVDSAQGWLVLGLAMAREAVLGALFGFAFGLILVPARVAGEYVGQEMGLSMASLASPMAENQAGVVGHLFEMLATILFWGLDGQQVLLATLHGTFSRLPLGGRIIRVPVPELVDGAARAQEWGLVVAAPVAVCLFVTSVLLALLARAAPQLNILSIGFSLRLAVGLTAMVLFMPELAAGLSSTIGRVCELFAGWV